MGCTSPSTSLWRRPLAAAAALPLALSVGGCTTGSSASFTMAPLFFAEYADASGEIFEGEDTAQVPGELAPYGPKLAELASYVPARGNAVLPVNAIDRPPQLPPAVLLSATGALNDVVMTTAGPVTLGAVLSNPAVGGATVLANAGAGGLAAAIQAQLGAAAVAVQAGVTAQGGLTVGASVPGLASVSVNTPSVTAVANAAAPAVGAVASAAAPAVGTVSAVAAPVVGAVTAAASPAIGAAAEVVAPVVTAAASTVAGVTAPVAPVVEGAVGAIAPVVAAASPIVSAAAPVVAPVVAATAPVVAPVVAAVPGAQQLITTARVLPGAASPPPAPAPAANPVTSTVTSIVRACVLGICR